jgi:small-conductance mechanosensitive channel
MRTINETGRIETQHMTTTKTVNATKFGMPAMILGFVAFAAVVGHFFAGPIDPPPPVEISIAEKAVSIRDATVAALKGEEYEAKRSFRPKTLDDYLTYSFIALAIVAILLSVIGFVRHESLRPAIAGASLGGLAIAFQFATVVFFGLLFAIVLAAVIDKLGFDF